MADWSADTYLAFGDERTRAARDLLAGVRLRAAKRVVDLGCGPGNSTALLRARFPQAELRGVDSSPDMLKKARAAQPDIVFEEADIARWAPAPDTDLLYANAVFHWLPDHGNEMRRLLHPLQPGSVLAIQVPDNLDEPSHTSMDAAAEPFGLAGIAEREQIGAPRAYIDALDDIAHVDVWRTVYNHRLAGGPEAIVDWFKGSGLRPYLAALGDADKQRFLADYRARIKAAYPALPDGSVVLAFPRLFVVATRRTASTSASTLS